MTLGTEEWCRRRRSKRPSLLPRYETRYIRVRCSGHPHMFVHRRPQLSCSTSTNNRKPRQWRPRPQIIIISLNNGHLFLLANYLQKSNRRPVGTEYFGSRVKLREGQMGRFMGGIRSYHATVNGVSMSRWVCVGLQYFIERLIFIVRSPILLCPCNIHNWVSEQVGIRSDIHNLKYTHLHSYGLARDDFWPRLFSMGRDIESLAFPIQFMVLWGQIHPPLIHHFRFSLIFPPVLESHTTYNHPAQWGCITKWHTYEWVVYIRAMVIVLQCGLSSSTASAICHFQFLSLPTSVRRRYTPSNHALSPCWQSKPPRY